MKRFILGEHLGQSTLLPESLDDYVSETNPVRVVDVFVDDPEATEEGYRVKIDLGSAPGEAMENLLFALADSGATGVFLG